MAITRFVLGSKEVAKADGWAEGAVCELRHGNDEPLVTWEEYKGKCVKERERNMWGDSDFFMTVYDENLGDFTEIMFATTRGWCGPAFASYVDASDEVRELYSEYLEDKHKRAVARNRRSKAEKLRDLRNRVKVVANKYDAPYPKLLKVVRKAGDKGNDILFLFGDRIRSNFKISLRNRILEWAKEDSPKYDFPLSPKQMLYVG